MVRTRSESPLMPVTLAVSGEDTATSAERQGSEVARRLRHDEDNRLIIGPGPRGLGSSQTSAHTRLHLVNIFDATARMELRSFIVGPSSRRKAPFKIQLDLLKAFDGICARRNLPYIDTFTPLVEHEQWNTDLSMFSGYESH